MHVLWRWRTVGAPCLAALAMLGCGGGQAPGSAAGAEDEARVAGAAPMPIPGTPAGGLVDWVAEIRSGLQALPAQAATEPRAAQDRALELYVGRQEYIEIYYGPAGRLSGGGVLGTTVAEAETRFHELMQLLGQTPAPDSARVATAVDALEGQLERVLAEARAAGVPLAPSGSADATSGKT